MSWFWICGNTVRSTSIIVTNGCLRNVLSGKAYAKALFCLKRVCEALERLLLDCFFQEENLELNPGSLPNLIESCDSEHLDRTLADSSTTAIIQKYLEYQERVRNGHLGKTAMFCCSWIQICCG